MCDTRPLDVNDICDFLKDMAYDLEEASKPRPTAMRLSIYSGEVCLYEGVTSLWEGEIWKYEVPIGLAQTPDGLTVLLTPL